MMMAIFRCKCKRMINKQVSDMTSLVTVIHFPHYWSHNLCSRLIRTFFEGFWLFKSWILFWVSFWTIEEVNSFTTPSYRKYNTESKMVGWNSSITLSGLFVIVLPLTIPITCIYHNPPLKNLDTQAQYRQTQYSSSCPFLLPENPAKTHACSLELLATLVGFSVLCFLWSLWSDVSR
jgi:hypothetical protein